MVTSHSRRLRVAAAAGAALGLLVLLWSLQWRSPGMSTAKPLPRVSIGIPSQPSNAAWFVGLDQGLFEQEGVDLVRQPFDTGLQALNALRGSTVDLAIVADTPFMFAVMDGAPIAIAVTTYNSRSNLAIIGRRDRGIAAPADLRGRTIGFVPQTNAHFFLDSFLLAQGMKPDQVKLLALTPTQVVPAFTDGTVDALSTWQPLLAGAESAVGAGNVVTYHAPELYTFRFNLVGTRDFLARHRDVLRSIIRGLRRANQAVVDDPIGAAIITERMQGAPLPMALQTGDYQSVLDQAQLVALEQQAQWALDKRLVTAQPLPNFLRHLAPEALLAEAPADVTLLY